MITLLFEERGCGDEAYVRYRRRRIARSQLLHLTTHDLLIEDGIDPSRAGAIVPWYEASGRIPGIEGEEGLYAAAVKSRWLVAAHPGAFHHPDDQVRIARELIDFSKKKGMRVYVPTHSLLLVQVLNNVMLADDRIGVRAYAISPTGKLRDVLVKDVLAPGFILRRRWIDERWLGRASAAIRSEMNALTRSPR